MQLIPGMVIITGSGLEVAGIQIQQTTPIDYLLGSSCSAASSILKPIQIQRECVCATNINQPGH